MANVLGPTYQYIQGAGECSHHSWGRRIELIRMHGPHRWWRLYRSHHSWQTSMSRSPHGTWQRHWLWGYWRGRIIRHIPHSHWCHYRTCKSWPPLIRMHRSPHGWWLYEPWRSQGGSLIRRKYTYYNVWVRYYVWNYNFKGYFWHATHKIS